MESTKSSSLFYQFSARVASTITSPMKKFQQNRQTKILNTCLSAEEKLLRINKVNQIPGFQVNDTAIGKSGNSTANAQYIHGYSIPARKISTGAAEKSPILLIHGYGMNSLAYMKVLNDLSPHQSIHCIDLPGMGLSSRDEFSSIKTEEQTIEYFTSAIESYRKAHNLASFILVGHSFGGYVGANYAMTHPNSVDQLVLLSPLGSTFKSTQDIQDSMQLSPDSSLGYKFSVKVRELIFSNQVTLSSANQRWYIPMKTLVNKYLDMSLKLQGEEKEQYKEFALNMLDLKESSERGIFNLLKPTSVYVKTPLEESLITNLDKRIKLHFVYGDRDWMDMRGAYNLYRNQKQNNMKVTFKQIHSAGHQLTLDAPKEIASIINSL